MAGPARLVVRRTGTHLRVLVDGPQPLPIPHDEPWPLRLHIDVGASLRHAPFRPSWPMWRGLPLARAAAADPFALALRALRRSMWRGAPDLAPELAAGALTAAYSVLRRAVVGLVDACDPAARAVALRFLPHLRWRVYARVVGDRSGRVAQLAAACPGALIYALALGEHDEADSGDGLLRDVVAGRALDRALADAIAASLSSRPGLGGRDLTVAVRQHRLLIRRAPARVPGTLLWLPPPVHLVPEDIPADAAGAVAWYRAVKATAATFVPDPGFADGVQRRLCAFASRHARALWELSGRHAGRMRAGLRRVRDRAAHTGRAPGPASDPAAVLRAARKWDREFARARAADELAHGIPTPPVPDVEGADLEVRALRTAEDLFLAGREMRNCLYAYLPRARAGHCALFVARVAGRRLAMELAPVRGRWSLSDVRGVANREPSDAEWAAVHAWAARAGISTGAVSPLDDPGDEEIPF